MNKPLLTSIDFSSENLYREWIKLDEKVATSMLLGINWMNKNVPSALIIGGVAVAHYLFIPRSLTPDIDYVSDTIDTIVNKLKEDSISFKPLHKDLGILIEKYNMDILDSAKINKELNIYNPKYYKQVKIAGMNVKILSPEILAIIKFSSGRKKDDTDAFNLLTSGNVNKNKFISAINDLRDALEEPDVLMEYSEIMP